MQLGELFRDVQMKGIFPDSKTFSDLQYGDPPMRSWPTIAHTRMNPASI